MDNSIIAIDLFCGAGGLTQGLKEAGFRVIGAVEKEPIVAETYKLNHSGVHLWNTDIQNLKAEEIISTLGIQKGQLDLLAGCPPCQGFSSMRTKNGASSVEDERNDLVFEMVRLVEELMPKAIMMENVPGLAKDPRMLKVLARLKSLGYHVDDETVQVHDISKYGVPQRRKRMILMTGLKKKIPLPNPIKK